MMPVTICTVFSIWHIVTGMSFIKQAKVNRFTCLSFVIFVLHVYIPNIFMYHIALCQK